MARAEYGGGSMRPVGPNKWELRVSAGRDPVTHRYRQVSRVVRGTKKEAVAALAALVAQVAAGTGGHHGTNATVAELVEQWLELKRETLSITTYEAYVGKARFRLIPGLGSIAVRKLTVRDIDLFYRRLRNDGLKASTIRQIHNMLAGSLDQAMRWGWRTDNPARLATLPPVRQVEVRPPAPAEVMAAIEGASPEFAVFLRVSAAVGSRRGEVAALRWSAVDFKAGGLVISRGLVQSRTGEILEKDTKTHQARRVAVDPATMAALQSWREACARRAGLCGTQLLADGYVFSSQPDGSQPWKPMHWTTSWRSLRRRIGINPAVRLHDLRHFTATRLLDAGVPVKTVSGRLGHSRPGTTLNVYAHFVPATDRLAADAMGRILSVSSEPVRQAAGDDARVEPSDALLDQ